MEPDCNRLSEHILQFTLEIIYLLTGEENIAVKKPAEDGQDSIMVPLRSLLIPERNNEQKILEITKKITDLLTGKSGKLRNFNIRIKEEIKEGEEKEQRCLEGHKNLYKDVVMENEPPLTSPDESSNGSPPGRCPRPLYSRDSTQESHTIPHRDQGEVMGMNVVVKKEEDSYVRDDQQPIKYDELMGAITKEKSSLDVSTGGNNGWITPEGRLLLSADYNKEDNAMAQYSPGNCEKSFIKKHELMVQQRVPTLEKPFTCSVCEKSFINKSRLVQHLRIHTGIKPCPCFICGKSFIDKSQLNRHQKIHTGERPFSCPECGKRFPSKGNRDKHMRVHTDKDNNRNAPEGYPRPLYSRDLTKEDHTIPHHDQGEEVMGIKIVVIEEEEPYSMDDQPSAKDDGLRMSMSKEDSSLDVSSGGNDGWNSPEERLMSSADYNKDDDDDGMAQYSSRVSIQNLHDKPNHMVRSTDQFHFEEPKEKSLTFIPNVQPSFPIADKSPDLSNLEKYSPNNLHFFFQDREKPFVRTHELIVHQRIPTSEKPFSCSECDKSFINKSRLVQHLRIHSGEKPFSCAVCGKSFIDKSQLNRHQIVHTGEKPFSCPDCGKRFPSKGNRDKHMRIHTGEKPFSCPECGKCFAQKVTLVLHQRKHTSEGL